MVGAVLARSEDDPWQQPQTRAWFRDRWARLLLIFGRSTWQGGVVSQPSVLQFKEGCGPDLGQIPNARRGLDKVASRMWWSGSGRRQSELWQAS